MKYKYVYVLPCIYLAFFLTDFLLNSINRLFDSSILHILLFLFITLSSIFRSPGAVLIHLFSIEYAVLPHTIISILLYLIIGLCIDMYDRFYRRNPSHPG